MSYSSVSLIQTGWKNTSGKEPAKRWTGMTRWSYEPSASDLTKESMWEERKGRKRLQPDMTRRRARLERMWLNEPRQLTKPYTKC
ncbi:hypothetical protein BLNAU_4169 [Blattamonas nauphoetae]|uniref:Uncharacterized protein n=1 Tax=Blattamonas nauphoetae TaxID=2049346 RepID=A0ABQ9YAM7_9EUKA|nr:hypothetical protein BLNAU_4169 [Blattamonas nauphoetae]